MSRCIIHIGMHKTGTSSIQQSLNGFADAGFFYADIDGHPNHSGVLLRLFSAKPDRYTRQGSAGSSRKYRVRLSPADAVAALERAIKAAQRRDFIISGEGIAFLSRTELENMRDYLCSRFDTITIVAAVRAPAAYMASAFQERVKRGGEEPFELAVKYRSYRRTFGKFDEVFGRENVQLWKFDPSAFVRGCAVQEFCSRLGINFSPEKIVHFNQSLSLEALALLFTYRKLGKNLGAASMTGPQNLRLVQQLTAIGGTKFRFSPDVIEPILNKNRADIEWMEQRLGQSLFEELGEHRPGDVRSEADLLNLAPQVLNELPALLGERMPAGIHGKTPEEAALLVHALRAESEARHRVTIAELLEQMQQNNPALLRGISKAKAVSLIRDLFKHMQDTLSEIDNGAIQYAGLGRFQINKGCDKNNIGASRNTHISFQFAESAKGKVIGTLK